MKNPLLDTFFIDQAEAAARDTREQMEIDLLLGTMEKVSHPDLISRMKKRFQEEFSSLEKCEHINLLSPQPTSCALIEEVLVLMCDPCWEAHLDFICPFLTCEICFRSSLSAGFPIHVNAAYFKLYGIICPDCNGVLIERRKE